MQNRPKRTLAPDSFPSNFSAEQHENCLRIFPHGNILWQHKKPNNLIENDTKTNSLEQYMTLVQNNFNATIQKIFLARQKSSQERADLVNRHRKSKNFEIGQLIWLKGIASATSPHRALKVQNLGQFKILQKSNDHTFFLARLSNPTKCDCIAHATHLEPYKCRVDMTPINFPSIAWNLN